ncbi:MAG: hypothetical protein OXM61_10860 [Candidatus Poribacteria bacterium]|nr:hypothetical protein [Candidatus Poribacteria bacterium]
MDIYKRNPTGEWETIAGIPKELVVGYGSSEIVVKEDLDWQEGIMLLDSGDAVCITPEGAYDLERYMLYRDESGLRGMFLCGYTGHSSYNG